MNFHPKLLFCITLLIQLDSVHAAAQTIQVSLPGRSVEGKPIFWNDQYVSLIARDGQLVTFKPREAESYRQLSPGFQSHSQSTLRGQLQREFGRAFDVSGTGQYLVVHPAGQRDRWADRFEQLYRSMQHYLRARGFEIQRAEFPFIAVVFPSQQQYLVDAQRRGEPISTGVLGHYDPVTNRIHMFDVTANRPDSSQWYVNAETIIHEAAHQTAFNVGIHDRFGENPRWVVEGLGTLFEARGVWDAHHFPERRERENLAQLQAYRASVTSQNSLELLSTQLRSDDLFRRRPSLAYAHAWALTFFLTEYEPRGYAQYLRKIRQRASFQPYPADERLQDFAGIFGRDFRMFDARLQRFVAELPATN